jgi:hypothetical protein
MKTAWTKGIKDKEWLNEIKSAFLSSTVVRKRLETLLMEKMEKKVNECMAADGYENPNWAYLMADAQGYNRAMKEIISLIVENKSHKS